MRRPPVGCVSHDAMWPRLTDIASGGVPGSVASAFSRRIVVSTRTPSGRIEVMLTGNPGAAGRTSRIVSA